MVVHEDSKHVSNGPGLTEGVQACASPTIKGRQVIQVQVFSGGLAERSAFVEPDAIRFACGGAGRKSLIDGVREVDGRGARTGSIQQVCDGPAEYYFNLS